MKLGQPLGVGGSAHHLEAGQEADVRRLAVARVRARALHLDDSSAMDKITGKSLLRFIGFAQNVISLVRLINCLRTATGAQGKLQVDKPKCARQHGSASGTQQECLQTVDLIEKIGIMAMESKAIVQIVRTRAGIPCWGQ